MATRAAAANKITIYQWEGVDRRGAKIKGEQSAKNISFVKAELRRQGINPKRVKKKARPLFGKAGKPIKPRDIAVFSRQLATMVAAGVPLVQAFEILAEGAVNPRMQSMIMNIKADVEGGASLAEALTKHPSQFDELFINLVRAGETAGILDAILDKVATYKENIESLKGKIKKALFYPAAVVAVAIAVSAILLIFVVPQFQDIFESFGADLPAFTQMIVNASEFMQSYGWLVLLGLIGAIVAMVMAKRRSRKFAHMLDRMVLKIPVIGDIMQKAALARFARTLATTFAAGVPLVEALDTVSGATGNIVYADAVLKVREDISTGHSLQLAMRQVDVFPHMVIQMTAIGEESGALDQMLNKVADFYEEEVNNAVDALSSLLEPFIMILIGIVVGGMVVGMYLPIFKMAAVM